MFSALVGLVWANIALKSFFLAIRNTFPLDFTLFYSKTPGKYEIPPPLNLPPCCKPAQGALYAPLLPRKPTGGVDLPLLGTVPVFAYMVIIRSLRQLGLVPVSVSKTPPPGHYQVLGKSTGGVPTNNARPSASTMAPRFCVTRFVATSRAW